MTQKTDVRAAMRALEARAASNDKLLKLLTEIDKVSDAVIDDIGSAPDSARALLPYSGHQRAVDSVWK